MQPVQGPVPCSGSAELPHCSIVLQDSLPQTLPDADSCCKMLRRRAKQGFCEVTRQLSPATSSWPLNQPGGPATFPHHRKQPAVMLSSSVQRPPGKQTGGCVYPRFPHRKQLRCLLNSSAHGDAWGASRCSYSLIFEPLPGRA